MTDETHVGLSRGNFSRWITVGAGHVAMVAGTLLALELVWSAGPSRAFLGAVALVVVLEVLLVWILFDEGTPISAKPAQSPRDATEQSVTLATWVTIARAGAVVVLAGFVATGLPTESGIGPWAPAALFALAMVFDAVDGAVARRTNSETAFGSRLDVEVDALAILVGSVVAIAAGTLPLVFLAVAVARYLFVAGRRWRTWRGRSVSTLPANRLRRPLGGFAMLAVLLALTPVPSPAVSYWLGLLVAVPVLANFCWDWLAVSGRFEKW
ncbi:CDP-alcohol phosphatidyltransferase family protein [Natronorubrum daqingense]|uniref:CDP-alcohol phosphatidyltransferase n=1 Tax=Natronorubrum daqingense TaxID=588898 RepID=A0A1N6Y1I8_9EURY|nr:CDP-alcohol phosphatidyltransferase family protein [Natronorubrum daqingense]APX95808.1 CDP-alcohol phosphatidyltransferase [Natronorubrum daqingense]SIR08339.1 CDP-diacylglycerol--glycerol-3-phosphate 3-phosphatidyltransferase [Natronorubrum daqingense]